MLLDSSFYVFDHGPQHLSEAGVEQVIRLIDDIFGKPLTCQELAAFFHKMVAVVFDQVILVSRKFVVDFGQKFLKRFLVDVGLAELYLLNRLAVGCLLDWRLLYSAPVKVL